MSELKYYQGKLDLETHATLKAAAAYVHKTIPAYVNEAITEKLKRDGYFAFQENERKITAVK